MKKSALSQLAKAVKQLDLAMWSVQRGSDEYEKLSALRQGMYELIQEGGYSLQIQTYRLVKRVTQ